MVGSSFVVVKSLGNLFSWKHMNLLINLKGQTFTKLNYGHPLILAWHKGDCCKIHNWIHTCLICVILWLWFQYSSDFKPNTPFGWVPRHVLIKSSNSFHWFFWPKLFKISQFCLMHVLNFTHQFYLDPLDNNLSNQFYYMNYTLNIFYCIWFHKTWMTCSIIGSMMEIEI